MNHHPDQITFDDMPLREGLVYCEVHAMGQPIIKVGMSRDRRTLKRRIKSHAHSGFRHSIDAPVYDADMSERILKGKLREHVIAGTEWVRCDFYVAQAVYEHFETIVAAQPNPWAYTDKLKHLRGDLHQMAVLNAQGMYGPWH